jgi:hypothetical protein
MVSVRVQREKVKTAAFPRAGKRCIDEPRKITRTSLRARAGLPIAGVETLCAYASVKFFHLDRRTPMTIDVGTASWTDPTLIASKRFYPPGCTSAEARLRFYATQFPLAVSPLFIPDRDFGQ